MTFLKFIKADTYEKIFELSADDEWGCWITDSHEDVKTTTYIEAVIDETEVVERNAAVDAATTGATHVAVEGRTFRILHDHDRKPLNEPRQWKLRAFLTGKWVPNE